MGLFDGDSIVALLGIAMALVLVSRDADVQRLSSSQKWLFGAAWAVIIGLVAALAQQFG